MLPKITFEGRLTADPDLRFLDSGDAVCSFTVVNNDRRKNDSGEWEDYGDPLFIRVSVWRKLGENAAESLAKGDLVICTGKLSNRKWEDREGIQRTSLEMQADTVAVSLQFRVVKHGASRASTQNDPWQGQQPPPSDEPPFLRAPEDWERGGAAPC
jgi:single-strand DNA-binding protein